MCQIWLRSDGRVEKGGGDRQRDAAALLLQTIDAEQVNQFIMRLNRGKASGLDDIYHEHLIFGNSEVLCASLASLYTGILSTA